MRALCIGRHPFLTGHLERFFGRLGLEAFGVTGLDAALDAAERVEPDIVLCDYDLLSNAPLGRWEQHAVLSRIRILAVSLTIRPEEALLPEINGIAGFLYLPALRADDVCRILGVATPPASFVLPSTLVPPAATQAHSLPR